MGDPAARYRAFSLARWHRDASWLAVGRIASAGKSAGEAVCGQVCRKQGLVEGEWSPVRVKALRPPPAAPAAALTRPADQGARP